jgi:magnesium transporter
VLVGGINGIAFALIMGLVAWGWFADPLLGAVISGAMITNLLIAGLAGTLIPLGIERIGQDPAIASTVFLTTITDVVGFFVFLGLATIVLI